jgi:hypothetical protein
VLGVMTAFVLSKDQMDTGLEPPSSWSKPTQTHKKYQCIFFGVLLLKAV